MKLQKILNRLQKLHPKKIDLSLNRIKNLCKKLKNPQKNIKSISVVGTNGKNSTIQTIRSILIAAGIKCNAYISPHIQKINERFIYNNKEVEDEELYKILSEVEEINNGEKITYFEILTAAFFLGAKKFKDNINIIESGLFHRFDATNIIDANLASIITPIGIDHTDWLPKNEKTIDKIIFEKTSSLLKSKIIVSKQYDEETQKKFVNDGGTWLARDKINEQTQEPLKQQKFVIYAMFKPKILTILPEDYEPKSGDYFAVKNIDEFLKRTNYKLEK